MTIKDSNAHRKGKHQFNAYLTEHEKALVDKAKAKGKVKTDRELIVGLSERFLVQP